MPVVHHIRCQGCGETGQAIWGEMRQHPDIQPVRTPLRVSGRFSICVHGASKAIACLRCQQIHRPEHP